jgi:1-acyl-sn-glycerol-3-phosphate acyltransferase
VQVKRRAWARWLLEAFGWRVRFNDLPGNKGVIIAYPHTSNWDFVVGILAIWAMGIQVNFWAKEGLFTGLSRFTLGPLIKAWGGLAVDRRSSRGQIDRTVDAMRTREKFWLALSPEGTRSYSDHWKSGFYHVALAANVPVGLAYFDFANKTVGLTEFIRLTGDVAGDLKRIAAYYSGIVGRHPQLAAPVQFRDEAHRQEKLKRAD